TGRGAASTTRASNTATVTRHRFIAVSTRREKISLEKWQGHKDQPASVYLPRTLGARFGPPEWTLLPDFPVRVLRSFPRYAVMERRRAAELFPAAFLWRQSSCPSIAVRSSRHPLLCRQPP